MSSKKLIVESVWQQEQGGGTEYLSLVYEHGWGSGLAKNQLQFLADEINGGRIVLPPPVIDSFEIKHGDFNASDYEETDPSGFEKNLIDAILENRKELLMKHWEEDIKPKLRKSFSDFLSNGGRVPGGDK